MTDRFDDETRETIERQLRQERQRPGPGADLQAVLAYGRRLIADGDTADEPTPEALDRAAILSALWDDVATSVSRVWRFYEANDECNEEQPALTGEAIPASLDEWTFCLWALREAWAARLAPNLDPEKEG